MATITTDTYLDDGTARTAGEAWTLNGAKLTIRTDTRWHADAPASMTGSLGNVTISSSYGGAYILDGTHVRWLAYDTGSSTVPAIGTTISQGGVSGYLLGVWASLTSAPTAVGASMPESGYIKFREVTGGAFTSGALSGISASATGADVVGWIEIVHTQATAITVPRLGFFQTKGDWFYLGTTSGSAGQVVQIPTNGSTTTYCPGLWIETATADVYEFYPSMYAVGMNSTNLGTDERSKIVLMGTDGSCTIGHNGTDAVGYVPPSGRKIRIPNVFLRQCGSTTRNTNAFPHATLATRPDFTTTNAGAIDIEYAYGDWYFSFAQAYTVKIKHSAVFETVVLAEIASTITIEDGGNGLSQSLDNRTLQLTSCFSGGAITDWTSFRHSTGTTDHATETIYCSGQIYTRVKSGILGYARSTGYPFQTTQSSNIKYVSCTQFNGPSAFTTCKNCEVTNIDHCDRFTGTTNATSGIYAIVISASSDNIKVDGITFGLNGSIANNHPYAGVVSIGQSSNITIRNLGTRSSFVSGGSSNSPAYIFVSGGNNSNIKIQRCYLTPTRTGAVSTTNSDKGMIYEHVYGDMGDTMTIASLNTVTKNCGGTLTTTGSASIYGTHFQDAFTSDTAGRLVLSFNEPTTETLSYYSSVGTPKFTSAGNVVLSSVGDEVVFEMPYFCKACDSLSSTNPTVTGRNVTYSSGAIWGNHNLYYKIDTGSGWSTSWEDLNGTKLSAETITPSTGFRLQIKAVCATAAATNLLTFIRINTVSTLSNQSTYLYPLDSLEASLTLVGLQSGSEVRIYRASDNVELAGIESSGTSYTYNYTWTEDINVNIIIHHISYEYTRYDNYTLTSSDSSIPVMQRFDRNYSNAV